MTVSVGTFLGLRSFARTGRLGAVKSQRVVTDTASLLQSVATGTTAGGPGTPGGPATRHCKAETLVKIFITTGEA